jgi:DNA-binding response OmpR family regulator
MTRKHKVLLAEDEEMHSFPMRVALERKGFEVLEVRNDTGVKENGLKVDALIIDARLPSEALEGLHAAAYLIRNGLRATVPIVFVSVYSEETPQVQTTLKDLANELAGRYIWLEKWFEPSNLVRIVEQQIEAYSKRSEE